MQSSGDARYPRLQRVLVSFGDKVGFAPTLEEALNQVFNGSSGAKIDAQSGPSGAGTEGNGEKTSGSSSSSSGASGSDQSASLKQHLADASKAMQDSDAALKKGDWAAYGEAQKRLNDLCRRLLKPKINNNRIRNRAAISREVSSSRAVHPQRRRVLLGNLPLNKM